jgi:hypothetical protein
MRRSWNNERGTLTLMALCLATVVGITLGSYIALSYQSLSHSVRSYNLNRARQVAETGLEEALWALNNSDWTSASWGAVVDADSDGSADDRQKAFGTYSLDAGVTATVQVKVLNYAGTTPTIVATSTVTALGVGTFTKKLTATTQYAPIFANAVAAPDRVRFASGGNVDSYNSTNGAYNSSSNKGYAAVVAAASVNASLFVPALTTVIDGYVETYGNSVSFTGTGRLRGSSSDTVNTARIGYSAFIPQFGVQEPTDSIAGYIDYSNDNTTFPKYGTSSEFWVAAGDLDLSGTEVMTINGPVKILVYANLNIQDTAKIVLTGANASLQLFVRGTVNIGGNGIQNNSPNSTNPIPSRMALFCTANGAAFNFTTNTNYTGTIYHAGPSTLSFDTNATISGAILGSYRVTFVSGSTPTIHYDYALRTTRFAGVTTPFMVNQLTEQ